MINFCTLFDSHYLSRGLVMYESLKKYCPDFHLYIFAFDQHVFEYLQSLKFNFITPISLKEFEDDKLVSVKKDRTQEEYCWTCTPSTIKYCIEKFNLDCCTYIDADLYFFSDPAVLITEMGEKSILITEHRYTPKYDKSKSSGIYCVQFMTFKNNSDGIKALNWWRDACIDWCFREPDNGRLGDQKYLDDWLQRFDGVHSLQHLGGGIAPWNVQQYTFNQDNDVLLSAIEIKTQHKFDAVFYHFHGLKLLDNQQVYLGGYRLKNNVLTTIYKPYIQDILAIEEQLSQSTYFRSKINGYISYKKILLDWTWIVKSLIKRMSNIYSIKYFTK